MQEGLSILVLVLALGYASWRIWQAFTATDDPCRGCSGCQLKWIRGRFSDPICWANGIREPSPDPKKAKKEGCADKK